MKMGNMLLNSGLMISFLLFSITLLARAGAATWYASLGLSEDLIQALGCWSSSVWKIYVRDNPAVRTALQLAALRLRLLIR